MKNIKKCLRLTFTILISNIFPLIVLASENPYKENGPYGTNCTWYVWKIVNEKLSINLPMLGDAKEWYKNAEKYGYSTGTTPKANSIVVWGAWTEYGHVGFVESVNDNIINVWDSTGGCIDYNDSAFNECLDNSYDEQSSKVCYEVTKIIACEYTTSPDYYGITGYIYLDNVPTKKIETKNNDINKEESKLVTKEKSNNAYLSSITLDIGDIDFNKDTYVYNLEVENEIDKVLINSTSEDEKAIINGNKEYSLEVGSNEIKLIVTAEDNSTKEYFIKIFRKEKQQEVKDNINLEANTNKEENKNNKKFLIIGSSIISVIMVILLVVFYKNKKN